MTLRQTELNRVDVLDVGVLVTFTSQWQSAWGHEVDGHGDPPESAVIIDRQFKVDGELFDYHLRVEDGCTFWAAPWEVKPIKPINFAGQPG